MQPEQRKLMTKVVGILGLLAILLGVLLPALATIRFDSDEPTVEASPGIEVTTEPPTDLPAEPTE